jgi:aspartate carbamoyltransferase catalytic subunit
MEKYAEQTQQEFEGWEEFFSKPVDEKVENFIRNQRIYDIIYAQQFDRSFLDYLCSLADSIRLLAKTKVGQSTLRHLLPHKRAMLYFVQPSTRTRFFSARRR